jgi:hypothetical protein
VATLFELEAGKALGDGDLDKGQECFGNALMVSTRYLGGDRMVDYAYAMTALKDVQDKAGTPGAQASGDRALETVFGAWIQAGQRFYGLREQVETGVACALVPSDFAMQVSVDAGDYAEGPLGLQPVSVSRTVSVQSRGEALPMTLTAAAGEKLLFAQDGYASFGKVADRSATDAVYTTKNTAAPITIQRGSVKLRGKDEDWAGIAPIFKGAESTETPEIPGSLISGGSLCRDEKNLYCRIDYSNGRLTLPLWASIHLELMQGKNYVSFGQDELKTGNDGGGGFSAIVSGTKEHVASKAWSGDRFQVGSSREGATFIELRLSMSDLTPYLDLSKPIRARVMYMTADGGLSSASPYVDILVDESGDQTGDRASKSNTTRSRGP